MSQHPHPTGNPQRRKPGLLRIEERETRLARRLAHLWNAGGARGGDACPDNVDGHASSASPYGLSFGSMTDCTMRCSLGVISIMERGKLQIFVGSCLLYTSDAAD